MQFDYEIPEQEFIAAQMLYNTAQIKGRPAIRGIGWGLVGLFFVLIGVLRWGKEWGAILLLITGLWLAYCGIAIMFPQAQYRKYYRNYYRESALAGKKYHAELDRHGFQVQGDGCSWQVAWEEVKRKAEDETVFMLNAKSTVFIFGKKFLSDVQQEELRQLAMMA